ncbi:hypothetical protein C5E07_15430 [Pseudoclavibacter sp. RFBJ3]|nr:hypothetical protein C5C12_15175 [Pseudoclavibacter sp. RFBJ5]PPF90971.1 hypothetical protein C5E07_15430 [Pseudoclavibacter sp. RFBJ3]PPG00246.1 hypothetical protein C5C19_03340 [Pseudoclavibacter sp. RFBH5]PPG20105.1 hypothetical protein C5E13_15375 [Pseudoclavibacter sp. RFBI4]
MHASRALSRALAGLGLALSHARAEHPPPAAVLSLPPLGEGALLQNLGVGRPPAARASLPAKATNTARRFALCAVWQGAKRRAVIGFGFAGDRAGGRGGWVDARG